MALCVCLSLGFWVSPSSGCVCASSPQSVVCPSRGYVHLSLQTHYKAGLLVADRGSVCTRRKGPGAGGGHLAQSLARYLACQSADSGGDGAKHLVHGRGRGHVPGADAGAEKWARREERGPRGAQGLRKRRRLGPGGLEGAPCKLPEERGGEGSTTRLLLQEGRGGTKRKRCHWLWYLGATDGCSL